MEIYDQNIIKLRMPNKITSVQDALDIHKKMVQIETKFHFAQDPYAMPHYRGEQKYGWDICSGLFRIDALKHDPQKAKQLEKEATKLFGDTITGQFGDGALRTLFENEKHGRDWDLLFQAQHAGIKTNLIDWSPEILSALFFSTEESKNDQIESSDGQLWTYMVPSQSIKSHNEYPVRNSFYDQDPFSLQEGCMINSSIYLDDLNKRIFESRMFKQKGRFYIPSTKNCHIPMNQQKDIDKLLFRFTVPSACKQTIRKELEEYNVIRANLYVQENEAHNAIIEKINKNIYQL